MPDEVSPTEADMGQNILVVTELSSDISDHNWMHKQDYGRTTQLIPFVNTSTCFALPGNIDAQLLEPFSQMDRWSTSETAWGPHLPSADGKRYLAASRQSSPTHGHLRPHSKKNDLSLDVVLTTFCLQRLGHNVTPDDMSIDMQSFGPLSLPTCETDFLNHLPDVDLNALTQSVQQAKTSLIRLRQQLADRYAEHLGGKLECGVSELSGDWEKTIINLT
ncbi:hypothetical protein AHF37_02649 [Paragonimus kellicotti]|nr:hypothetical protein AHF37_02649 [Paragonimus kellicotti]